MSYGKGRTCVLAAFVVLAAGAGAVCRAAETPQVKKKSLLSMLDAPMLFVKRQSYTGIHIYDTYFKWRPGGGIYVLENPAAPPEKRKFRAVIDPGTPETLGEGIYSEPEISWDAKRILFCFKGKSNGNTSIYEIGIDGKGLRRLTDPSSCRKTAGRFGTHHDVGPAYLGDGRIIFTSTRPSSLVPCNNTAVDILHVMNADGTGIHPISVNNVNEFDPCILPDGRILHGRWEYVDKTALTQQSIWTIFPDGTNETALFANNLVHPEAVLDARPVPGAPHLVAATFTPHNAPPRGSIAIINPRIGRDSPAAITNFEHKNNPTHDRGNSCEPWPLSKDVILFSGRSRGLKRNAIEIMDRSGRREVVHADPKICCHSPMLVKPRQRPRIIAESTGKRPDQTTGRFYVQNIYDGLPGVKRGEVKWLRVIDETSRVSAGSTGGNPFNQTFLVSAALAFGAKNFLGVVPVEPDGSAYFEVPSGRTVYFQALDGEWRLIQSMRTFIQAAPGVTRSCIGCHENKFTAPANMKSFHRQAIARAPSKLKPESWGSGFVDYPGMVQPILDKHCVGCHGGRKGIAGKLDLSGGWTEYFSISYENLASRRKTQITADLIAGIDCMNGTSLWSAKIMPPRAHGSAVAPLAEVLVSGHKKRIEKLTRAERDLIMAWIDTNGLYHGTWNRSKHGHRIGWANVRNALIRQMQAAGCARCHGDGKRVRLFEGDWINLKDPEFSRILRAPLPEGKDGFGLGWCRDRKIDPREQRICMLVRGYAHGVMPLARFARPKAPSLGAGGEPVVTFASTKDPHYQAMLKIIRDGRRRVLAAPRVDMPGAEITAGLCRYLIPPSLPESLPALKAHVDAEGVVRLSWERSAWTIGLSTEVHRGAKAGFVPDAKTLLAATRLFQYADAKAPQGPQHYALILVSTEARSTPIRATVTVPPPKPPPAPAGLKAAAGPTQKNKKVAWGLLKKPPWCFLSSLKGLYSPAPGNAWGTDVRLRQSPERAQPLGNKSLFRPFRAQCWWAPKNPGRCPGLLNLSPSGSDISRPGTFSTTSLSLFSAD